MSAYQAPDFYQFDSNLSDEERGVRDTVRSFVDQRFMQTIREHFAADTFPTELIPEMGAMGLLGTAINYVANNRWTFADQEAGGASAGGDASNSPSSSASS